MRTLVISLVASAPVVLLLAASCVVTDVEEVGPDSGGSGGGKTGTGAFGGTGNTTNPGGSSQGGGSTTGGSGGGGINAPGVECGDDNCTGVDVCCIVLGASTCMTEPECLELADMTSEGSAVTIMKCDDALDCDGTPCCVTGVLDFHVIYECSADKECELWESCSSNGQCLVATDTCVTTNDGGSDHKCVDPNATVECDGATCAGSTPTCCEVPGPSCVPYDDPCFFTFECDGGSDCGGALCCSDGLGSTCRGQCNQPYILCDDVSDCPSQGGPASGCAIDANVGPAPGYKVCVYP